MDTKISDGIDWREDFRAVLRRGLQPALADEGRGAPGPEGPFVVPVLAGLWGVPCGQKTNASSSALIARLLCSDSGLEK